MLATCPRCGTRVMPMPDGRCPACKRPWSGDHGVVILAGIGILLTYVWPRRPEKERGRTA